MTMAAIGRQTPPPPKFDLKIVLNLGGPDHRGRITPLRAPQRGGLPSMRAQRGGGRAPS